MAVAKRRKPELGLERVRMALATGATGVAAGVALAVLDLPTLGAVVTVGSLLLLVVSVHSFGRTGADPARSPRRRRKR